MIRLGGALAIAWASGFASPPPDLPAGRPPAVRVVQPSDAPASPQLRPEPIAVPPDGRDRLSAGAVLLAGGVVLSGFAGGLLALADDPSRQLPSSVTTLVVGGGAIVGGSVLLGYGRGRLRDYQAWQAGRTEPGPSQGRGMIGAGAGLLVVGVATIGLGTWSWVAHRRLASDGVHGSFPADTQPPTVRLAQAMVGIGAASGLVGGFVLGYGARRNKAHHTWRRFAVGQATVLPRVAWLPGGIQLGIGGRF